MLVNIEDSHEKNIAVLYVIPIVCGYKRYTHKNLDYFKIKLLENVILV